MDLFGIGSAVGGIANGIGSVISGKAANRANLKINQMNNDFNREEAQKARDFQLDMWNRENEYNSPAAQRARFEAAGYNPYMSNVDAGSATGVSGTDAASAAGPIAAQPVNVDFASPIQALAQASKFMSEKNHTDIQTLNYTDLVNSEIWKNIGATDWRNASPEARKYNLAIGATAANLQMKQLHQNWTNSVYAGILTRSQIGLNLLDAQAKSILNKHLDAQQLADLNLKAATYELEVKRGAMTEAEYRESVAREVYYSALANGQRISNRVASQTADSIIKSMNMSNVYDYNYAYHRNRYSQREALEDVEVHTWENRLTEKLLNKADFDERLRPWREAIDSANKIIRGVGNTVGTIESVKNGRSLRDWRKRSLHEDYSWQEDYYPNDDGGWTKSGTRRYRK